jgi:hypothetical protein
MNALVHEGLVTEPEYRLTAETRPAGVAGLWVRQAPAGPWYTSGQTVSLTAGTSDPHYAFAGWDPGPGNPDGSLTVTMDGPVAAAAVFRYFAHPPQITALPDTAVDEDGSLVFGAEWLGAHVSDANDPVGSLRFEAAAGGPFSVEFDSTAGTLTLAPAADYAGTAAVAVRVVDPDGAADTDTFTVTVRPMPDPPGSFGLLSPADGSGAASAVRFSWQASADPDAGDGVTYRVVVGPDRAHPWIGAVIDSLVDGTSVLLGLPGAGTHYWTVEARDTQGHSVIADAVYALRVTPSGVVSENGPDTALPGRFSVGALYPNPFNPGAAFELFLPADAAVRADVYDVRGSRIRVLRDGMERAGARRVEWDGRDDSGRPAPSGVYTVRVEAGGRVFNLKATLAK